ncbi:hypothetical protein JCM10213_007067 [Rhodosporidiobolus nylandii]
MHLPTSLPLSLLALSLLPSLGQAAAPDSWPDYPTNRTHYLADLSWRGLQEGRVKNADVGGHASALPGVHDFLRLVPPTPLAHGSLYLTSPLPPSTLSPSVGGGFIVELAFRVHGPPTTGLSAQKKFEVDDEGRVRHAEGGGNGAGAGKGGRGLAFWVTKERLPTPATISGVSGKIGSPPPLTPSSPNNDPTDPSLSLFGSRVSFSGLGIIFDSSPSMPLFARSSARNLPSHHSHPPSAGVGLTGVVSGILDDATGGFLDKEGRQFRGGEEEEAGYLERAVGECEAAFRNAQGLLWARVGYVGGTIRVDLDLSPHTSLSKAGRHYEHNCFTLEGVKLPRDAPLYFGISGLASGGTEPDAVDVYAMDVFEVLPPSTSDDPAAPAAVDSDEPAEPSGKEAAEPLEGTSDEEIPTLTHELFLSQARIVEAIDALARRVEALGGLMERTARGLARAGGAAGAAGGAAGGAGAGVPEARLAALTSQLDDLTGMLSSLRAEEAARAHEGESLTHLLQLQERLMEEVKSVGRRVEGATGQHSASLSTLSSRSSELLTLSKSTAAYLESQFSSSFLSGFAGKILYALGGVGVGVVYAAWREKRRREGDGFGFGGGGGKKYF